MGKLANLSSIAKAVKEEKKLKKTEVQEEQAKTYSIQEHIHINQELFMEAMSAYLEMLKIQNKHNLVSILEASQHHFTHNRWELTVPEGLVSIVEKDQEMLPFLREKLRQPNLFVELRQGSAFVNPYDKRPYTEEEKLKEMSVKNPALLELQKRFKTRIIY